MHTSCFYQSDIWLFGKIGMHVDDKCVLSNEDDNCKVRYLVKRFSGVDDDEIDFERWRGILLLLLANGGLEQLLIFDVRIGIGGL